MELPPELTREWTVERDFIDAIRTGREVHPDFYDGLKYMELTEAIMLSADEGERVSLEELRGTDIFRGSFRS